MIKKRVGLWLASLVTAVVLACGFATPAKAAEWPAADATGAITLTNIEEGVKVHAYKVASASWDGTQPTEPAFTWDAAVANWIKDQNDFAAYVGDGNVVTEAFSTADAKVFYDKLAAAIKAGTISLTPKDVDGAGDKANTVIDGLDMGAYLIIIDNSTKYVYQPIADNVIPVYNESTDKWELKQPAVNPDDTNPVKREELDIDKTVENKKIVGAQYGDTLNFKLVSPVPTCPANAVDKLYGISDTMKEAEGLSFIENSVTVYGLNSKDQDLATGTKLTLNNEYTQNKKDSAKPANNVSFGLHFVYDKIKQFDYIAVTYQAVLNSNAKLVDGVKNEAKLEWSNDPYTDKGYAEIPDKTTVYPYGLDVLKVDSKDEQKKLAGAEFSLAVKGGAALQFVDEGNGAYHVFDNEVDKDKTTTGTLVTNDEGKLIVNGLNKDVTYVLTETKAPAGYVKPSESFEFTIKDDDNDGVVNGETNSAYIYKTIKNDKGFDLPTTGGPGTIALTAAGVVLMGGAAVLIARGRKQN